MPGIAAASNNVDNATYQDGPVAHSMTGEIVDWGSDVNSLYTNATSGDPGLIKYLASQSGSTTDIGGVTAQYMDSSGKNAANDWSYGNQYEITPSDVSGTTIYDTQIQNELTEQINEGNLPTPAGNGLSTIYLVLFPSGDVECYNYGSCSANAPGNAGVFCSYHSSFQLSDGTYVLYSVVPDDTSGPQSYECGPQGASVFDDQTSYLSHEWSETITDPLGDAWWVDNASSPDDGNEIADNCNQMQTSEGGWIVQELWSNLDGNCTGSEPSYSAPNASFLAPDAALPAAPVTFDARTSSDPAQDTTAISGTSYSIGSGVTSYQWNWGDGSSDTTSASPTATHSYDELGDYNVTLTVTDELGFTSSITKQIDISATGTADPSVATGGSTNVSGSGATIEGEVNSENQSTEYQFVYGTSPSTMTSSTAETAGPSGDTDTLVDATLSDLEPSTTYYYELQLTANGETYYGSTQSFKTNAAPPPPQTPIAGTGSASAISTISAILSGTVNPGGSELVTYKFSYGTSPSSLNSSVGSGDGLEGTTAQPVSSIISGLSPGTTYYYRLDAMLNGTTYSGSVESFTTRAGAPGVSTGRLSAISSNGANVTGSVSPNGAPTNYMVQFGTTGAFGRSTPEMFAGAGHGTVPVMAALSGLKPLTRYYYRLVAISSGGTTIGGARTFVTSAPLKPAPLLRFSVAVGRKLKIRFHCSKACSAHFVLTVSSGGLTRVTPVAVTFARATRSIRKRGWAMFTIRLSSAVRNRLRAGGPKLVVVGYASAPGSNRSAPQAKPLRR